MRRWMLAATVAVLTTGCRYETVSGGILHLDDDEFSTAWRLDRWTGEMCWFVADDVRTRSRIRPRCRGASPENRDGRAFTTRSCPRCVADGPLTRMRRSARAGRETPIARHTPPDENSG